MPAARSRGRSLGRRADAEQLTELVEQEATLRRLAELAARGAERQEVFEAIVAEACRLFGPQIMLLMEFDGAAVATVLAQRGNTSGHDPGTRVPAAGDGVLERVLRTGRATRVAYADMSGPAADRAAAFGVTATVGAPIHVDGRLWGLLLAAARDERLPMSLDARLASFAELLGPAIAGAIARAELVDLLEEQAALRRVAELVARGAGQQELFQAVADEASKLVQGEGITLLRMTADGTKFLILATRGSAAVSVGTEVPLPPDDEGIIASIFRTRAPARVDNYRTVEGTSFARDDWGIGSAAGVPIILDDRVWGVLAESRWNGELPAGVERRLGQFAELVAAALANSAARAEVQALADEQAALRRVAELVARAARPQDVFAAVAREAARLLGEPMTLIRLDEGGALVVVARGAESEALDPLCAETLAEQVVRTRRAARADQVIDGSTSAVAAPISIGGRIWGLLVASSTEHNLMTGTEARVTQFAELIAVAIANAESRAALSASRARVLATADEVRRRIQRDVHDGAQQRLVQTVLALRLAKQALGENGGHAAELVAEAVEQAEKAAAELADIVRGILPATLTRGGLSAGIKSLVADLPLAVELRVECGRLGADLETTAYFVVAESLTNVVKHAHAERASVTLRVEDDQLVIEVADDGVGGVDPERGTGITGLFDRVEAAGGRLALTSPSGAGTTIRAALPLTPASDMFA